MKKYTINNVEYNLEKDINDLKDDLERRLCEKVDTFFRIYIIPKSNFNEVNYVSNNIIELLRTFWFPEKSLYSTFIFNDYVFRSMEYKQNLI